MIIFYIHSKYLQISKEKTKRLVIFMRIMNNYAKFVSHGQFADKIDYPKTTFSVIYCYFSNSILYSLIISSMI